MLILFKPSRICQNNNRTMVRKIIYRHSNRHAILIKIYGSHFSVPVIILAHDNNPQFSILFILITDSLSFI